MNYSEMTKMMKKKRIATVERKTNKNTIWPEYYSG
jgi:hypothetical protein